MNTTDQQATALSDQKEKSFMSLFGLRPDKEMPATAEPEKMEEPILPPKKTFVPPTPVNRPMGPVEHQKNVFTEGLTIEGNVTSETDIVIRGTVRGNIVCHSDVELSGQLIGDLQGKNIRITEGSVQGNIMAEAMLSIDRSSIKGNITATHARINNPIEGDMVVHGMLTLQREADIHGNITAEVLSVDEGASMNGQISIIRERSETSYASQPAPAPQPRRRPDNPSVKTILSAGGSGHAAAAAVAASTDSAEKKPAESRLPLSDNE